MSHKEQLQRIANIYMESGEPWPATARQIAAWAVLTKRWSPHPESMISQCADELGRAMGDEYYTDPQGRSVRSKHAARVKLKGKQTWLWDDIRTGPRAHLAIAFQQRRQQIVGDCRQLKADVDSFNENRSPHNPIQMVFDFTRDLEEFSAAS